MVSVLLGTQPKLEQLVGVSKVMLDSYRAGGLDRVFGKEGRGDLRVVATRATKKIFCLDPAPPRCGLPASERPDHLAVTGP